MTGLVCLQGGRELTPACREMDADVLGLAPVGPVGVLAGAARVGVDYDGASGRAARHYGGLGASVVAVPDPRVDLDAARAALDAEFGLVVLPGGSPSGLLAVLTGAMAEVGERLVELHRSGVALSGASAGAMVLCSRTFLPDRRRGDGPEVAAGLGLVAGLALPHWSPGPSPWPVPADLDLWGLPECGGVVLSGGGVRAVGRGEPSHRPAGGTWSAIART